jgi:diguanylate cyclase (GGDEF)-like protein
VSSGPDEVAELTAEGLAALGPGNACDREPIHLSGAIQPHGVLVAFDPRTRLVQVASTNLSDLCGTPATAALGRPVEEVLGATVAAQIDDLAASDLLEPAVATVTAAAGPDDRRRQDLTVHRSDGLVVCELEPSTAVSDDALVGFYQAATRIIGRLHESLEVEALCRTAVRELRALIGYDRVMVYRFDADAHGEIIAEARRPEAEPFLGLHYPAGDVPRQARRLYLRNWLRVIGDVDYTPAPLLAVPGALPEAGLDLSLSALRSVSPLHLHYLRNMGVRATLTISLIVDGRLWGMIACHHDAPHRVSGHLRAACTTFGQAMSLQLRAAEEFGRHDDAARLTRLSAQVVTALAAAETLASGVLAASAPLLGMVGAHGAVLTLGERRTSVGEIPPDDALDLVARALQQRAGDRRAPVAEDEVVPVIEAELGAGIWEQTGVDRSAVTTRAAGALYLPLGQTPGDAVLWLRGEQTRTVRWAGRAEGDAASGPGGRKTSLTPRSSFAEWQEIVRGRSTPWRPVERDVAQDLAQAYPELLLHRSQNRLVRLALHDALTGLPNRAMLLDRLSEAVEAVGSDDGRSGRILAVMFVDLDHFKDVNDTHGHDAGDALLIALANRLTASLRPEDTLARIGGDEFVLLVPSVTGVEQAIGIAHRIVEQCRIAFPISPGETAVVSASVGIALHHGSGDAADILRRADNALYYAKRAGRDQIRVYGMEHEADSEESRIEAELDRALADGDIRMYLQPVIRLGGEEAGERAVAGDPYLGGLLHGAEALVRWQHPQRGLIMPDRFIPLAERTGQIHLVGEYVLDRALRALSGWGASSRLTCAVNVSVAEVGRAGFAASVQRRLAEHGVDPHRLCLEITETQMMQRPEHVAAVLTELGEAGVRIAIDDFGTGFSSLAYVRNLPAHILKIDRMFVSGLPDNPRDVAVVAATVRLAHEMGMEVVAEGVETVGQAAALRRLGCDLAQGYLFGRPVPLSEFDQAVTATEPRRP